MNQHFKMPVRWTTETVARLADIEPPVLRAWRAHYGFLGGSHPGTQGRAGGYMHDLLDTLVSVATADIVRRGISPARVAIYESDLRATFARIIEGKGWPTVIGCYPDKEPRIGTFWTLSDELSIREALARSPTGAMLIVDLAPILERVRRELQVTP
jgi:hypothetical protein